MGSQPFPSPGDLPNPGIEPRSPTFWHILYQLSHQRSPGILEWVAQPFSSRSSQSRNRTRISCIAGRFFSNWAMREPSMANSKWWINGASTVIPFSSISPWKSFEFGNPFRTDLQYSQLHMCFYLQLATTLCLSKSTFCSLDNFTYKSYNITIRSEDYLTQHLSFIKENLSPTQVKQLRQRWPLNVSWPGWMCIS